MSAGLFRSYQRGWPGRRDVGAHLRRWSSTASGSFFRRPLPTQLTSYNSQEGRLRFRESLAAGTCDAFFPLSEVFNTQDEPAFCGVSSLCMVLNALQIDPGPTRPAWRTSVWRWFDEQVLDLGEGGSLLQHGKSNLADIAEQGITLTEFGTLAEQNGAKVRVLRPEQTNEEAFRQEVIRSASSADASGPYCVVAFARRTLGQTGDGHFSPIAAYHAATDSALVLDTARFKYPPYWVSTSLLWQAMKPVDSVTGQSRGFALLEAQPTCPAWVLLKEEQDRAALSAIACALEATACCQGSTAGCDGLSSSGRG